MSRKRAPAARMNLRQVRFVAAYVSDPECNASKAAIAAGYSRRNAANRGHELLKMPLIVSAVNAARTEIAERGNFSAEIAMRRLESGAQFAILTGNATALARFNELMLRLHGLLIDKAQIQVEHVDISGTMIEARKRVSIPQMVTTEYARILNPFD